MKKEFDEKILNDKKESVLKAVDDLFIKVGFSECMSFLQGNLQNISHELHEIVEKRENNEEDGDYSLSDNGYVTYTADNIFCISMMMLEFSKLYEEYNNLKSFNKKLLDESLTD